MAQHNANQAVNQNFGLRTSHARSLSQPTFFSNSLLPPLSPCPPCESSMVSANSSFKDALMEEADVTSRVPSLPASFIRENTSGQNDSLPPRRGHRRSSSDVPWGFSDMIQSSPQLVPIGSQGSFGRTAQVGDSIGREQHIPLLKQDVEVNSYGKSKGEGMVEELFRSYMNLDAMGQFSNAVEDKDKESMVRGGGDSNTETECFSKVNGASSIGTSLREGVKRSAIGDLGPTGRHFRSLSMDSGIGSFHLGDETVKILTSQANCAAQLSGTNSVNENTININLDFASAEFSEAEVKKIMSDERLAEIAISDPKRAKRILANRQSAARSKERKLRYISELEHKVQTLQTEATTLSAKVRNLQKDFNELKSQNSELKFRLQAMERDAQLRDALHEKLDAEAARLRLATAGLREEGRLPSYIPQLMPMKHHVLQMQRQQSSHHQQLSLATSSSATSAASSTPTSA